MAVYKPYKKTSSGKEEIKIPYSSINGTPTIPTVNDGTLTIQKNGTTVKTFSANQSGNVTANITVPTKVSELENDSEFTSNAGTITGIKMNGASKGTSGVVDLGTVITAHQDISGKQDKITSSNKLSASLVSGLATVATSGSYDDLSHKPTIPTVNNGTLTIQKNGTTVGTFTANQKDGTTANITVPTKASDVNALSLDGGTINKSKTIKMDASANSDGANLKWGTVNSKNPYIGYASDQVDGTFVVGSLLGTDYASGLAIGGGSGNLLWKGTKVATTSDIPTVNNGTLTIKKNGTSVGSFTANQSGASNIDITFHLYEHNIYLSCSKATSTSAPSRAYVYFTVITTSATAWNWNTLISPNYFAGKGTYLNAGGYGYIADPEGNNRSYNGSVQTIYFGSSHIVVEMIYNNSLLGIDNEHSGAFFYSSDVTITDKVRTIL